MSHTASTTPKRKIFSIFACGLLSLAVFLGYHHTLQSPFLLDDGPNIVKNPYIQIQDLSFDSLQKVFSPEQPSARRPVASLSFALNYLYSGYDPAGFHSVNIFIHILTAFTVLQLFLFYFSRTSRTAAEGMGLALAAALLWTLNPLQTSAVTYIVQRMTILCTLFFSASLLAYIRARQLQSAPGSGDGRNFKAGGLFLLAFFLWLLAMKTKEIAAIMPVILLLHELFFFRTRSRNSVEKYKYLLIGFGAMLLFLGYQVFSDPGFLINFAKSYEMRDFTLAERLLTEARVVLHYMGLFLLPLPSRMTVYYDYPVSVSLLTPPATLLSFLTLGGMSVFSVLGAKKYPLLSFALLWTLLCLVIESTVLPLELVFEHRFYLPSIGFSLLLVAASWQLFGFFSKRKWVFYLIWGILCCILLSLTYSRNRDWQSELSISLDAVEKTPLLPRAVNNLAGAYIRSGDSAKGLETLEQALRLDPDSVVVLANLFMLSVDLKQGGQAGYYLQRLKTAIRDGHFSCKQSSNILLAAEVLVQNGRFGDAIFLLESLGSCRTKNAVYFDNLGLCYSRIGRHRKAMENFEKAFEKNPGDPYIIFSLSRSYLFNNRLEEARRTLERLEGTVIPEDLQAHLEKLRRHLQKKKDLP